MLDDDYLNAVYEANLAFNDISQCTNLLDDLNGIILEDEVKINNDVASIMAETTYSSENNGLAGAKVGSSADGENDEDFFIPYYDENGDCYFLINQFNPLIGYLARGNSVFRTGGCSPASYANAFIMGYGVHSLVDSIGILGAFLYLSNDSYINGDSLINVCTDPKGNGYDAKNVQVLSYLYKYIYDENGKPRYSNIISSKLLKDIKNPDYEGGAYALRYTFTDTSAKGFDTWVSDLESRGYEVTISIGGINFGEHNNMFGGTNGGHYGGIYYNSNEGLNIMDSYGARTFKYERENMGLEDGLGWGSNNGYNEDGVKNETGIERVKNKKTATEDTFWHKSSVMIGTSYNFKDLQSETGIGGGGTTFITIKKKTD